MAWRHLRLDPDQWRELPWHHKRVAMRGLLEEFRDPNRGPEFDSAFQQGDAAALAAAGFTVRTVTPDGV